MPPKKLHTVMIGGTGSDVGKSIITAALCRIFKQDGYNPSPFKAQNMSLNSYATPEGLEIGRAQAVQAEAAGIPCHTDMNPLLLKPSSDMTSQVVLNGIPIGHQSAIEYFSKKGRQELINEVHSAFNRLESLYSPIVLEGAGSIAELNLKEFDLVNLPMARHAKADVILVADIEKGGVFASAIGTIILLDPEERAMIKGIIINKFRGDIRLFEDGVKIIEEKTGVPVLGVIPTFTDIIIEDEDSLNLHQKSTVYQPGKVNIAVILLNHLSNFTDFNVIERDSRVHLFYSNNPNEIIQADIVIIPGSKSTIDDLISIRKSEIAQVILKVHEKGGTVLGICGGYQMMGTEIHDSDHVEGNISQIFGLGLLPVSTTLQNEKVTKQVSFHFLDNQAICHGYEIHMGKTIPLSGTNDFALNSLEDGRSDGYILNHKCMGTYIHGILDNQSFIDFIIKPYSDQQNENIYDLNSFKEDQYDKLAHHVRSNISMDLLYKILSCEEDEK